MPPHRILFVDDEPNIRLTLAAILKQHGFDVTTTATVREALAEISSNEFDVLIADLDIGEPGDGFTVVSAMRRSQPNCVNLILTGYPAFESALKAIQAHVDDYLVKPTDIGTLVAKIEERLNGRSGVRHVPSEVR
jgi:DNA-binding NtrC family response regulator